MRLLVYGDSNSWGLPPSGSGLRMAPGRRWPGGAATRLGAELIEEALPGRTTVHDDPAMLGKAMNGLRHLPVALRSHAPLDLVLIMLGTNDCKARFFPDAGRIAANIARLVETLRRSGGGRGPWAEAPAPDVAVIAPPPIGERAEDPAWPRHEEWLGGRQASRGLFAALALQARRLGFPLLDAGAVVSTSALDPIHMDEAAHRRLGVAVAEWIAADFGAPPQPRRPAPA